MNVLEKIFEEKEIPYALIGDKYTLFTSNGFPILNIEIDEGILIRPVNLNIDEYYFERDCRCYKIHDINRLYDIWWRRV